MQTSTERLESRVEQTDYSRGSLHGGIHEAVQVSEASRRQFAGAGNRNREVVGQDRISGSLGVRLLTGVAAAMRPSP